MKQYITRTVVFDEALELTIKKEITAKESADYPELEILNADAVILKMMLMMSQQAADNPTAKYLPSVKQNVKNCAGGTVEATLRKIGESL